MTEQATRIIAIRHGETDWNLASRIQGQLDIGLNEAGHRQARRLAAALAGETLDAVYTSDLARARDTAQALVGRTGLALRSDRGLRERRFGIFEGLTFAEIEQRIKDLVAKTEAGKLSIEDLRGGTFTITNGGVFGSLLSTPILNPPQVGILGLHKIEERPVALNGQVVIRPMMYVALSYDHRIVDGREAVQFLVHINQALEDPAWMLVGG